MAQGDVTLFEEFLGVLGKSELNLDTDVIKIALIKSAANGGDDPAASDADPGWAVARTTDFNAAEVAAGGTYTAEGDDITSTYAEAAGVATFDGADNAWLKNASNPTNARWAIIYDDTDSDKKAICFVDLGADFDMTTGDLNINFHANGIFTITIT